MSETTTEVRDESTTKEVNGFDPFKAESWAEPTIETKTEEVKTEEKKQETTEEKKEETQQRNTPSEWYKEFGFENEEVAKTEVKRLKETPATAAEIKFANEQSKLLFDNITAGKEDEVFNILDQKRKLDKLTSVEINENTAGDIVKLAMQNKYKELSASDIDYKFNKQYTLKEPKQGALEDDDTFQTRQDEYKEKLAEIKQDLMIEARLAKPELEKLKSELVLPNIQKGNEQTEQEQQAQKELQTQEIEKRRTQYLSSLSSDFKNFNGFETKYVNEGVEIPVSYTVTDEEKTALKTELESFDLDGFVLKRWFNEDGSPNVKGLMKDIYLLRNEDKIHQKIANETGVKVLDNYIKNAKNVSLSGGNKNQMTLTDSDGKQEIEKAAGFFFTQGL